MAVNASDLTTPRPVAFLARATQLADGQFTRRHLIYPQDIRSNCLVARRVCPVLLWPQEGSVTVRALAQANFSQPGYSGRVAQVSVLGYDQKPQWTRDEAGLHVRAPFVQSAMPVVLKILVD
jgi:alpha-L-fucosidase